MAEHARGVELQCDAALRCPGCAAELLECVAEIRERLRTKEAKAAASPMDEDDGPVRLQSSDSQRVGPPPLPLLLVPVQNVGALPLMSNVRGAGDCLLAEAGGGDRRRQGQRTACRGGGNTAPQSAFEPCPPV